MKKTFLQIAMLAVLAFVFASCQKEPDPAGGSDTTVEDSVPTDEPVSLLGSRWVRHVDKYYEYDEIIIHVKFDTYLDFHTDSTGLCTYVWGDGNRDIDTYEYTFDGEYGHFSFIASDNPAFEPYGYDFRYIAAKDRIQVINGESTFFFDRLEE